MNLQVLAVYDQVAKAYLPPMFVPNIGTHIRAFIDQVNRADENNNLYMHPEDFILYHIGEWNDETGEYSPRERHEILMKAATCAKRDS